MFDHYLTHIFDRSQVTAPYKTFLVAGMKMDYVRPVAKDVDAATFRCVIFQPRGVLTARSFDHVDF